VVQILKMLLGERERAKGLKLCAEMITPEWMVWTSEFKN
jgi:hypothetical protein